MFAPRQSYFPKVAADALRFFQHALARTPGQEALQPWLDYRGLPLKWSVPVGVLYDLLVDSRDLPWELTVHLHGCPEEALAMDGSATMRGVFLNSLKEAAYISRGSEGAAAVMQMSSAAQDDLWAAVQTGELHAYRRALSTIRLTPVQRSGASPTIPVRMFVREANDSGFLSTWEMTSYTSRPVDAHLPDGSTPVALSEVLRALHPRLHVREGVPATHSPERDAESPLLDAAHCSGTTAAAGAAESSGGAGPPAELHGSADALMAAAAGCTVKVAGVEVPLDAPLAWLHAHFHAPDYFLYLVVHARK